MGRRHSTPSIFAKTNFIRFQCQAVLLTATLPKGFHPSGTGRRLGRSDAAFAPRDKGSRFTQEEDELLIDLKEQQGQPWKDIKRAFPNRSQETPQVRYCTKLKGGAPVSRKRRRPSPMLNSASISPSFRPNSTGVVTWGTYISSAAVIAFGPFPGAVYPHAAL